MYLFPLRRLLLTCTRPVSCKMTIFLFFFKLFIILFLHYVSVIFKNRKPLIKLLFAAFVRFKLRCKMSGVILKSAKSV